MREALGDGYTEALREAWPEVPESADFVMYWWQRAAQMVKDGRVHRFGLITTNSIRQPFNRRIIESNTTDGLSLVFAVPDHPWVENADGAAVRIAMTVGASHESLGRLSTVQEERDDGGEGLSVVLTEQRGVIHPDLRVGANLHSCVPLLANLELSNRGYQLFGAGFIVTPEEAEQLRAADTPHLQSHPLVHEYRNGRDLTDRCRGLSVIDAFGLTAEELRTRYPAAYQRLYEHVKPERDHNNRQSRRTNWWLYGEPNKKLREQLTGLSHYIATVETAKHRVFQFLEAAVSPDNKLVCIALADAYYLGILSSTVHTCWALATGSWLGVGNDPVYVKSRCFEHFPFPSAADNADRIRTIAEQLDAHRKRQQAAHPELTLTAMYNVLEKLRAETALSDGEKRINDIGLISVLRSLHDDLDRGVHSAYGWADLIHIQHDDHSAFREALLHRLAALNAERQAEESRGQVRWLRPEFQNTSAVSSQEIDAVADVSALKVGVAKATQKRAWPADLPSQMAAIADVLTASPIPISEAALAEAFSGKGAWRKRLPQLVDTLVALARAERTENGLVAKR